MCAIAHRARDPPAWSQDMGSCLIEPADKSKLAKTLGGKLVERYGQRRFYTIREIKSAYAETSLPLDWSCWGYAMFSAQPDFDAYHGILGETCDYVAMKGEMLASLTSQAADSWFSLDMSWIDLPDLDLGSFFDPT
jgi:hypothetical protein